MNDDLILKALDFASEAHKNDTRKYTGEPYIFHPIEVAQIVFNVMKDPVVAAAALMHDVIEDTPVTEEEMRLKFGDEVTDLVMKVTKVTECGKSEGARPRAVRKELDRIHYSSGCSRSQSIKLADVLSNSSDVVQHDPKFAKTYLVEQKELVASLTDGHPTLFNAATEAVDTALAELAKI